MTKEFKIIFRMKIYVNADSEESAKEKLLCMGNADLINYSEFFDIEEVGETGYEFVQTIDDALSEQLLKALSTIKDSRILTALFRKEYITEFDTLKASIKEKIISLDVIKLILELENLSKI